MVENLRKVQMTYSKKISFPPALTPSNQFFSRKVTRFLCIFQNCSVQILTLCMNVCWFIYLCLFLFLFYIKKFIVLTVLILFFSFIFFFVFRYQNFFLRKTQWLKKKYGCHRSNRYWIDVLTDSSPITLKNLTQQRIFLFPRALYSQWVFLLCYSPSEIVSGWPM